jgi:hypothetical protein
MMRFGGSGYARLINSMFCSQNPTVEVVLFVSGHFRYTHRVGRLEGVSRFLL